MSSYQLLSSTRHDRLLERLSWNNDRDGPSPFFLLPFHLDRLLSAAEQHDWHHARTSLTYQKLKAACLDEVDRQLRLLPEQDRPQAAYKLRITLAQTGDLTVHATPATPFSFDPTSAVYFHPVLDKKPSITYEHTFTLYLDPEPTSPSLFTRTKTTQREPYNLARQRAGVPLPGVATDNPYVEVVLHNENNLVSEASISNIALHKSHGWITPPLSTGCLPGVLRRWLLQQGRIYEGAESDFAIGNLKEGDWLLLFNSVQGCRLGQITARTS